MLKILSYNLYGILNVAGVPNFKTRYENLKETIESIIKNEEIDVLCFQEVNKHNMSLIDYLSDNHGFKLVPLYPMLTSMDILQYNAILVKKDIEILSIDCIPHNSDLNYRVVEYQKLELEMSDYRTTVVVKLEKENVIYLIGNIHTDHLSYEGKIQGVSKSLKFFDNPKLNVDIKILLGDMNMVVHLDHVRRLLKDFPDYVTLSRSKNFNTLDNSYHGYGKEEAVNADFAFIPETIKDKCSYQMIRQEKFENEGSDHRPVVYTIN